MDVIRIHQNGGPEVMKLEEIPTPKPGPLEALVKIEAAGVNFIDTYQRTGLYKLPLPFSLGLEGAGFVESVGASVTEIKPGDRVAFAGIQGAYATYIIAPQDRLVVIPDAVSFQEAAAVMLQGMTAHYLSASTYPLKRGDSCLIHAIAGGVGALLCQMAKKRGALVIGTAGTDEKVKQGKETGADHVINYSTNDFEAEVKRITNGKGVNVVYDGVGKSTFEKSLNSLAVRGMLVSFGQSSGLAPPFDPQRLSGSSLFFARPRLFDYIATREELTWRSEELFGWLADKTLKLKIDRVLPLAEAPKAHQLLEGRQTAGKLVLQP